MAVSVRIALAAALIGLAAPAAAEPPAEYPTYRAYRAAVDRATELTFRRHGRDIDPMRQRGRAGGLDLDHIVPVKQCWLEGWTPERCGAWDNLRMLEARRNRSEGCREICGRASQ